MSFKINGVADTETIRAIGAVKQKNEEYFAVKRCSPRVFVRTFGCQQNEADSEHLLGMAITMGYTETQIPDDADLIIVNTCAVREHAEKKTLSVIGQYKHIKEKKPDLIIAVCGCMVGQESRRNELKLRYPYVDFTVPPGALNRLPRLILDRMNGGRRCFFAGEEKPPVVEGMPIQRKDKTHAYVSVMYGCNNFCTYCIVPYVRGRERSRHPDDIEREVRELVSSGYSEITLLGQNVNSYGKGCDFECDFATLISHLAEIEGDFKLHFMTSHPKDATFELIDAIASHPRIANHFHLPLQSGSDRILERMNRHYTLDAYMEKLDYLRERVPDVAVSTDIIVGFPGETEEDFEQTLKALERARYDRIFSFIFSERRGTPAAEMENKIPDDVKSERFNRLIELQNRISLEKNQELVGKKVKVLCDGKSKNDNAMLEGRTEQDKIVIFEGDISLEGKEIELEIVRADTFNLYGKIIEK